MGFGYFSWFGWLVVFSFSFFFFSFLGSWVYSSSLSGLTDYVSLFVCFDSMSVYLGLLTFVICICVLSVKSWLGESVFLIILLSQFFAVLCYVCVHALLFWVFYEMSIVLLLYLLLKESPYSERYSAFWYFSGYIIFSSLPMVMVLLYLSISNCSFSFLGWDFNDDDSSLVLLLSVLFATKIPLFPFQAWLPIVHAEASSVVSVCLSGYIMKLGLLGLFRLCWWVIPTDVFFLEYTGGLLFLAVLFGVCSCFELDSKRWLAYLSLSHISIVPLCLCVSSWDSLGLSFSYCLGHGLSTSVSFIVFWFLSSAAGGRSWFVMKNGLSDGSVWLIILTMGLCLCSSLPFSLQFFCELQALSLSLSFSGIICLSLCLYLFFVALVPMVCLGHVLTRSRSMVPRVGVFFGPLIVLGFLVVVNFSCFLIF